MCFNIVFTIILVQIINLLENFKSYNFFPRYALTESLENSKICDFCKIALGCYPYRLTP